MVLGVGRSIKRKIKSFRTGEAKHKIMIVSVPKSGTVFMARTLSKALNCKKMRASPGAFPNDFLDYYILDRNKLESTVSSSHLAPDRLNTQMLDTFFGRWHVHLRDPRSVTLSWTHHLLNYAKSSKAHRDIAFHCWRGPNDPSYLDWDFDRLLEWNIKNFLPIAVDWEMGWLDIYHSKRLNILLTNYNNLLASERLFLDRIAEFFDLESAALHKNNVGKNNQHFRSGKPDEWSDVFSLEQKEYCDSIIPGELLQELDRDFVTQMA